MMISSSREADYTPKEEDKTSDQGKTSKTSSSSTSWSRLKDPRIVRVSRAFGGKDRHSKVCTVRGLRDRRVRLSVPTAIQLYDLQDRLGLNQPSKVVDWLLNVAKHEIDELPPLQMPPNLSQLHQPMVNTNNSHRVGEKSEGQLNWNDPLELSTSNYWGTNSAENLRYHLKSKEIVDESEKRKQGDLDQDQGQDNAYFSSSNFFGRSNHQPNSLTGLLNNFLPAHNSSFLRRDPSNLLLSHQEDHLQGGHNFNVVPILPSTSLSMPSGSQFVVYPPVGEFDPKNMINFQMLSSASTSQNPSLSNSCNLTPPLYTISQATRPFHLSMNPNRSASAPNKDD